MKKLLGCMTMLGLFGLATQTYAGTGCIATGDTTCNTTTQVQVNILPGNICIGSTGAYDFGDFTVSSSSQTVPGAFTAPDGYFWVDDLKGATSGYYTTVQLNADMTGPDGASIPRANVYMKTSAVGNAGITTMAGTANIRVGVHTGMSTFQSLDAARQLIIRNTATNLGIVGKYGTLPQLQLIIPAYQAVGNYTATLTYTLYEN